MPKVKPARTTRIILDIPNDLHARLDALAEAERRGLKAQLLVIVERACKMAEGRKRAAATRRALNSIFKEV